MPTGCGCRGSLSQGHAALAHNCQACHVQPFVSVQRRMPASPATPTSTTMPTSAGCSGRRRNLGGLRRVQQIDRQRLRPGRRAAASNAIPSMKARSAMVPTPQQFCADCHTDLRARLPDTRLANASDFEDRPSRIPAVGADPLGRRAAAVCSGSRSNQRPREMSNLKFPHALHLDPRGGVAQMGGGWRALRLRRSSSNAPTATCRRRTAPASSRSTWRRDCGMCHSLAFDQIGGTIRTPAPRLARAGDRRHSRASTAPAARSGPPSSSAGARAAAGRRQPDPRRRPVRPRPGRHRRARASRRSARSSQPGRRLLRMPRGGAAAAGHARLSASARSPSRPATCCTAGSITAPTRSSQRPGPAAGSKARPACASCHAAPTLERRRPTCCCPNLASCRACHGGETTSLPVASTCAMCHDYPHGRRDAGDAAPAARARPALGDDGDPGAAAAAAGRGARRR